MMGLIDTHSHLFLEEFDEDRASVVRRAKDAGVTRIYMPNIDSTTIPRLLRMCDDYPGYCFPMVGLHPTSVSAENLEYELQVVRHELETNCSRYCAVGEIGMDFYWDKSFAREQEIALATQIEWALEFCFPVVIHCRDACDNIYKVLTAYAGRGLCGIFHSFTGSQQEVEAVLELPNFYIGVNGIVTFKKSSLPEVLTHVPLTRLLLETDSPYLAPVPHRGRRNESANVSFVAQKIAEIYGVSVENVIKISSRNALKVLQTG